MKVIETVKARSYRYYLHCTREGCLLKIGLDSLDVIRTTAEAHAFATGHDVQIMEREA